MGVWCSGGGGSGRRSRVVVVVRGCCCGCGCGFLCHKFTEIDVCTKNRSNKFKSDAKCVTFSPLLKSAVDGQTLEHSVTLT